MNSTFEKTDGMLLMVTIVAANIDYIGLIDYALKALVGGIIWVAFRIYAEKQVEKLRNKKQSKSETEQTGEGE